MQQVREKRPLWCWRYQMPSSGVWVCQQPPPVTHRVVMVVVGRLGPSSPLQAHPPGVAAQGQWNCTGGGGVLRALWGCRTRTAHWCLCNPLFQILVSHDRALDHIVCAVLHQCVCCITPYAIGSTLVPPAPPAGTPGKVRGRGEVRGSEGREGRGGCMSDLRMPVKFPVIPLSVAAPFPARGATATRAPRAAVHSCLRVRAGHLEFRCHDG